MEPLEIKEEPVVGEAFVAEEVSAVGIEEEIQEKTQEDPEVTEDATE